MRSHVFLTPMTPDGKPGEVQEIVFADEAPKYLEPMAYHDDPTRSVLESERDTLAASLPKLTGGARSKADHRLRILERLIRKAFDAEETARRNTERQKERQRQQVGADSPFARQSVVQSVQKSAAETKAGWERHLAGIDAWLKEQALAKVNRDASSPALSKHSAPICCSGRYLCPACERKKATAAA